MINKLWSNYTNHEVKLNPRRSVFTNPLSNLVLNGLALVVNFVFLAKIVSYIQAFNRYVNVSKDVLEIRLIGTLLMFIFSNILFGYLLSKIRYEKKILRYFDSLENRQEIELGSSRRTRFSGEYQETDEEQEE